MGYGMHRDKFGNSRGSNPIGLMEMVSYLPTRMGLVSYFDTGLIFTTFYYYLIILLVTWSHILWIHRLHRLESWDTYHPYKLTQCQLYNPPMGSTLSPRLGPSKEEQLREEVPDGFGVLGLGEPWFQEQFTVERKKIRVDLENSVFGVYIYIYGDLQKTRPFNHIFGGDRNLRAWYRGIKNAAPRKRAQGRAQDIPYQSISPYHHGIWRIFIECGKKTHARKSAQGRTARGPILPKSNRNFRQPPYITLKMKMEP